MVKFSPLNQDEISIRVQSISEKRVNLLLYIDARTCENILDNAVGCMNWQRIHSRDNSNCTISIWCEEKKMWVAKEDTGTRSNAEGDKGIASDSFKRACVNWGIGRELFTAPLISLPVDFVNIIERNGSKSTYDKFSINYLTIEEKDSAKEITALGISVNGNRVWAWEKGYDKPKFFYNNQNPPTNQTEPPAPINYQQNTKRASNWKSKTA